MAARARGTARALACPRLLNVLQLKTLPAMAFELKNLPAHEFWMCCSSEGGGSICGVQRPTVQCRLAKGVIFTFRLHQRVHNDCPMNSIAGVNQTIVLPWKRKICAWQVCCVCATGCTPL